MTRSEKRLDVMQGQRESPQTSSSAAKCIPVMSRLWFAAQYPLLHLHVHLWFSSMLTILGKNQNETKQNNAPFVQMSFQQRLGCVLTSGFIQKSRCLSSCSSPFQRHLEVVWVLVLDEHWFQGGISTCCEWGRYALYTPKACRKEVSRISGKRIPN